MNYYNEFDPKAAAWLRELIKNKLIPDGIVDTRSIADVQPNDLKQYTQCHFFAGIGGWSLALRLAGWPSDRPVWTGSCPCQPFSAAGKQLGTADERHLWPIFHHLIAQCRPPVVFGEQVASKLGRNWLAGVRGDLEGVGYAVGAADLCAPGVGAPHIRQRLYWVADTQGDGREQRRTEPDGRGFVRGGRMGNAEGRVGSLPVPGRGSLQDRVESGGPSAIGWLGDTDDEGPQRRRGLVEQRVPSGWDSAQRHCTEAGFWGDFGLVHCADGKTRRFEPSAFPLAHGIPGRVGLLRGYGNAIVPPLAAEFIKAYSGTDGGSSVVSEEIL